MCFPVGFGVLPRRKRDTQTPMCTSHEALSGVLSGRTVDSRPADTNVLPGMKSKQPQLRRCVLPGRICFNEAAFEGFQHRSQEILRYRCVSRYPFVCFHVGYRVLSRRVWGAFRYGNVCFPVALYKEARDHEIKRQENHKRRPCGPCGKDLFIFCFKDELNAALKRPRDASKRVQSPNSKSCVTHRPRSCTSALKSFADEVQTM